MNILIAEDNEFIQILHRELMRKWGFDFDLVSSGKDAVALAQARNGEYDFCLMDVEMPIMNGIEATKIIRKSVKYFPIMALTSNDDCKYECYKAGMDGFALKSCLHLDLLDKIKKLSVKVYKLVSNAKDFELTEVMPVDRQHADELKKLKSQGLVKMRLDGPDDREVIAHKNTPNKISYDFNVLKQSMTEFLNRDPDRPTSCDLYRGSKSCIVETFVDDEEYRHRLSAEDEVMEKYTAKYFKSDEE